MCSFHITEKAKIHVTESVAGIFSVTVTQKFLGIPVSCKNFSRFIDFFQCADYKIPRKNFATLAELYFLLLYNLNVYFYIL